jgi:hypothetical protein
MDGNTIYSSFPKTQILSTIRIETEIKKKKKKKKKKKNFKLHIPKRSFNP